MATRGVAMRPIPRRLALATVGPWSLPHARPRPAPAPSRPRPRPAAVGPAGPVRRLLRRQEKGYLRRRASTSRSCPGGPDVIPQHVGSAPDGPEFTISWVPKVLEAREAAEPSDLVDIAQIFQRSGTLRVTGRTATSPRSTTQEVRTASRTSESVPPRM